MWEGKDRCIYPREFRDVLCDHAQQFLGYEQHDRWGILSRSVVLLGLAGGLDEGALLHVPRKGGSDCFHPRVFFYSVAGKRWILSRAISSFADPIPLVSRLFLRVLVPSTGLLARGSQEFLAYLLDGIHEDVNRVREKPFVEKVRLEARLPFPSALRPPHPGMEECVGAVRVVAREEADRDYCCTRSVLPMQYFLVCWIRAVAVAPRSCASVRRGKSVAEEGNEFAQAVQWKRSCYYSTRS